MADLHINTNLPSTDDFEDDDNDDLFVSAIGVSFCFILS